jgi:serine/threonine-protein kinase
MEWLPGADAQSICAEFRVRKDSESGRELLRVTRAILEAYVHLHEQGIIHGDIHPRNVLIDRHAAVKIIDLGLAHRINETMEGDTPARGGVGFFFEPEFARAVSSSTWPPQPTFAGEQYSLAAMLYLLLTGAHYLDFSLEKTEMLRQIAEAPMVPFARRGIDSWPETERLIEKGLSKQPVDRFPSVAELARLWPVAESARHAGDARIANDPELSQIRAGVLRTCAIEGPLLNNGSMVPPTTSINYGSAGLAYAIYRVACAFDDAALLALADVWSDRSLGEIWNEGAFYNSDLQITPETVGASSLYHGPAGVFLVQALIAKARGDTTSQYGAIRAFIDTCRQPCEIVDLTLGRAGALLGCTFLLDSLSGASVANGVLSARDEVRSLGNEVLGQLGKIIDGYAPIGPLCELKTLGIAHGWAGLLYAVVLWCVAADETLPSSLRRRLQELAECAEPASRGLQWKWDATATDTGSYVPGWCNGSAGYVFLWTQAYQATGEETYLEFAEGAAWHVWETLTPNPSLCCGMAGQAFALLNFSRHSGDLVWLRRAREVARSAGVASAYQRDLRMDVPEWRVQSLYKGDAGLAVLDADLAMPDHARMPLFEREA